MKSTFIYNDHLNAKKVLSTLESELELCEEFIFSVAFISESGLTSLLQTLKNLEEKNVQGKILTTNYLYFNTPKVLDKISKFKNIELRIYDTEEHNHGFHTKGYLFRRCGVWRTLLGSSNLTISALTINKEWNTFNENEQMSEEILNEFNNLWSKSRKYNEVKEIYIKSFAENKSRKIKTRSISEEIQKGSEEYKKQFSPNTMQQSFIENFVKLRENNNRALLISATGTGKTYAAVFAMKNINAKKLLFVVHREQIARQALETFKNIFGETRSYGLLTGNKKILRLILFLQQCKLCQRKMY